DLSFSDDADSCHDIPGPGLDSSHHLVAFIACWLSRCIFVESPQDGVNHMFSLWTRSSSQGSLGVESFNGYPARETSIDFDEFDDLSTEFTLMDVALAPLSLLSFIGEYYSSVSYNRMRAARQFGFDQGCPIPSFPLSAAMDSIKRFLNGGTTDEMKSWERVNGPLTLPMAFRERGGTTCWRRY
ncbi:hypothetical protein U1Q18_021985, partial [Sarracenia purpurea var. burkii]